MTATSGMSLAGTGPPPVRSSAPGEGRDDAPAKRGDAGRDGAAGKDRAAGRNRAAVRRVGRGRADPDGVGAATYGAGDEGATVSDRMENVVLPRARRSDRFHLRNDNRIR